MTPFQGVVVGSIPIARSKTMDEQMEIEKKIYGFFAGFLPNGWVKGIIYVTYEPGAILQQWRCIYDWSPDEKSFGAQGDNSKYIVADLIKIRKMIEEREKSELEKIEFTIENNGHFKTNYKYKC